MNWNVDYIHKFDEYERLGISEYWVVDYLGIASSKFIGKPKVATVFVHLLDTTGNNTISGGVNAEFEGDGAGNLILGESGKDWLYGSTGNDSISVWR